MTIYALLSGNDLKGRVTFHGITSHEVAAEAWAAGGASKWYWEVEADPKGNFHAVQQEAVVAKK